jgi:hypothetical protein
MAIDRNRIISELSKMEVEGNEEGMIPALGVYVQQLPADFWNEFSLRMVMSEGGSVLREIETGLMTAARDCGYHTGHGIITSPEWNKVVLPMIEKVPEDILHGAYAVFAAWGWADAEIVRLVPGETMVVRASSYYEADGAIKAGLKRPFAHMIAGVSAAFMDLAYGEPYPAGRGTYKCEQTKAIEVGDPYGEFVVTRK